MMTDLFDVDGANLDRGFENLKAAELPIEQQLHAMLQEMWGRYEPYADPDFRQGFARDVDGRFWEMYLGCTLLEAGRPRLAQMAAVEADVLAEIEALLTASAHSAGTLIAVTNEVGFGIVPATRLARFFRDCAGRVNQRMAAVADEVHLVVSGIPVRIKGG